jgi:hypothetical protein
MRSAWACSYSINRASPSLSSDLIRAVSEPNGSSS